MGVESMRYRFLAALFEIKLICGKRMNFWFFLFINVTYYALCEYLWVWKYVL